MLKQDEAKIFNWKSEEKLSKSYFSWGRQSVHNVFIPFVDRTALKKYQSINIIVRLCEWFYDTNDWVNDYFLKMYDRSISECHIFICICDGSWCLNVSALCLWSTNWRGFLFHIKIMLVLKLNATRRPVCFSGSKEQFQTGVLLQVVITMARCFP